MTYPAKAGQGKPEPIKPLRPITHGPVGISTSDNDRFKLETKAPSDRLELDDDILRALGLQGAGARLLQAILDKPGIGSEELADASDCTSVTVNAGVAVLMDKGYVEVKLVRDPNKRGGMVRAHYSSKEGLRASILSQLSNLRSVLEKLGGSA